jgi:glycosyltransferase involved in cell wall biosynthesis
MGLPLIIQTFSVPLSLRFVEGQVAFWRRQGFEVHILTDNGPELTVFMAKNDVVHHIIPFKRSFSVVNALYCLWLLICYFKKYKPAVVHGNTPKAALITIAAAWLCQIPTRVYEMHGLPLETAKTKYYPIFWLAEKLTCTLATTVMAVSESLQQVAIDKKVVSHSKINVNHNGSCNGVDSQKAFNPVIIGTEYTDKLRHSLGLSAANLVVGFVGRMTFEKGIRELYEAWQMVKILFPDAKLLLVGGFDKRQKLPNDWIEKLTNDGTICFAGHVENVAEYYSLMDFLVLPSHREGLGNVVLEAAAMQKPAIVTKVTGLKNTIVENETGLFSEPRSITDLVQKMVYYIENQHVVMTQGRAARKRVINDFRPEDVWQSKLRHYQRLITAAK